MFKEDWTFVYHYMEIPIIRSVVFDNTIPVDLEYFLDDTLRHAKFGNSLYASLLWTFGLRAGNTYDYWARREQMQNAV